MRMFTDLKILWLDVVQIVEAIPTGAYTPIVRNLWGIFISLPSDTFDRHRKESPGLGSTRL